MTETADIAIAEQIWDLKYRLKAADGTPADVSVDDTRDRVAAAVAAAEAPADRAAWTQRFRALLDDHRYLPAGRILAGAGADRSVTLFNCFVMGAVDDSMAGIFDALKEGALTLQQGGGVGYDFSTLRPKGALVKGVGADASGPLSFMEVWDAMCRTIMSAGARRGAMMATLRCDHPDVFDFITAKTTAGRLTNFNLSVLITDPFMEAVAADGDWPLVFGGETYKTVRARELWDAIMRATYEAAEPGVIFIDRINQANNLAYCESIQATNPCGEQPLPPYGACLLGSMNLTRFVARPFEEDASLDLDALDAATADAVRFMDDVVDVSNFPLEAQRREAQAKRRIGLGVTGLADAFAMVGARYGDARSVALTDEWLGRIQRAAYRASARLAAEKGAFPLCDAAKLLEAPGVKALDEETRALIEEHGLRNALLTSIAPTGTISLFAGNVSSGVEPIFALSYVRKVREADGSHREETVEDYAVRLFRKLKGADAPLPEAFVTAQDLAPADHLAIQAAAQPHVDSAISKTVNCPPDISFEAFKNVYAEAYAMGLKGCTTYRPTPLRGSVLTVAEPEKPATAQTASETERGAIVQLSEPLERDEALEGMTYKLRWPESAHAMYVTINDIIQDGRRRPFEIFINSKNMEHYAWTVALTRMISAVFRRGGDVSFVVEELQAVFDPQGGAWMGGRYVPSLLAAIGDVVEKHMRAIGFLKGDARGDVAKGRSGPAGMEDAAGAEGLSVKAGCPRCGAQALRRVEGCDVCTNCHWSRCG